MFNNNVEYFQGNKSPDVKAMAVSKTKKSVPHHLKVKRRTLVSDSVLPMVAEALKSYDGNYSFYLRKVLKVRQYSE